ncbi:hypothetical protein FA95DRAFT_1607515 [Auriscalpium vulgare]|uniref:Uncharacterized protein n=1 Tax=Auriscalpium vulgare TaxID=40419 RepID=A0ACB8RPU5_9AGAM|nr:hypothetical protein FA95DRAFT_1607515 [Auriscalpium vulgare]
MTAEARNGSDVSHGLATPSPTLSSVSTSLTLNDAEPLNNVDRLVDVETLTEDTTSASQKKKKKKKGKKSAKKEAGLQAPATPVSPDDDEPRPPVLCISRNKHWRYISSYHGPWLQLPIELLESLLVLNLDPATMHAPESRAPPPPPPLSTNASSFPRVRDRGFAALGDHSPPDSPHSTFATPSYPPLPSPQPGRPTPPPIDPGVFRSVTTIRRLIDEAAELSVRASSGLSAAALGSMRGGGGGGAGANNSPWALAQSLGINPLGEAGGGRNVAMSAMRIHRLRALAVQKLAAAYRADEIASSVMVMQGGSVFDDIAERVLKFDPNDADAKYVHFFHEKIPSRQLAESTTTHVLDELIAAHPQRLEFLRTRGIVHTFRDEYSLATKDFTYALKEARAVRKARTMHRNNNLPTQNGKGNKKKKGDVKKKSNGQAPPNGTSASADGGGDTADGDPLLLHPSVLPDAPEPIEPQLLFLRGAAYLQHAVFLIEEALLKLEGIRKVPSNDGAELRLCYVENGRYGGVEIGNPEGPLGRKDGPKLQAYRAKLAEDAFREQICALLKKSVRDHERFLAHFDTLETPVPPLARDELPAHATYAFLLAESLRPGTHAQPPPPPDAQPLFTTYHPLLVEAHFSILLCQLMLGDFSTLLRTFVRAARLVDGLEGYPVFLPPRSMAQAEFVEVLERLAGGWRAGVQPHSLAHPANGKLAAIEAPPPPRAPSPPPPPSGSAVDPLGPSTSSAQPPSGRETPLGAPGPGFDLAESLDSARIVLAPVVARQRARVDKLAVEKAAGGKKKPVPINIPLHGPRVEIVLAWVGAVWLVELDGIA